MGDKKSLEQVLQELKEAEKEFNDKCIKYGIKEKQTRKKKEEQDSLESSEENTIEENKKEETSSEN